MTLSAFFFGALSLSLSVCVCNEGFFFSPIRTIVCLRQRHSEGVKKSVIERFRNRKSFFFFENGLGAK